MVVRARAEANRRSLHVRGYVRETSPTIVAVSITKLWTLGKHSLPDTTCCKCGTRRLVASASGVFGYLFVVADYFADDEGEELFGEGWV